MADDIVFTESKVIGQAGKVEEGAFAGAESQSQKLLTWDGTDRKQIVCNGQEQNLATWETDRIKLLSDNKNSTNFYVTNEGVAVPATGYRALNDGGLKAGTIMAKPGEVTYVTFNDITKMDAPNIADSLQLDKLPTAVGKFDVLQIIDDVKIPTEKWNKSTVPEPIVKSMNQYGKGGATQVITNTPITDYNIYLIDPGAKK